MLLSADNSLNQYNNKNDVRRLKQKSEKYLILIEGSGTRYTAGCGQLYPNIVERVAVRGIYDNTDKQTNKPAVGEIVRRKCGLPKPKSRLVLLIHTPQYTIITHQCNHSGLSTPPTQLTHTLVLHQLS